MSDPMHRRPVLDMTPDGGFREPPRPAGGLNAILARVSGLAILVAVVAGGLLLAALAIFFIGLLLPVALGAAAIAGLSMWWRRRRMRAMGLEPQPFVFVVRR
jgi:CHASE2 domain-containing sensor protein